MNPPADDPWADLFQQLDPALAALVADHYTDPHLYRTAPDLEDVRQLIRFVSGNGSALAYERYMRDTSNSPMSRRRRGRQNDAGDAELLAFLDERTDVAARLILAEFLSPDLAIGLLLLNRLR